MVGHRSERPARHLTANCSICSHDGPLHLMAKLRLSRYIILFTCEDGDQKNDTVVFNMFQAWGLPHMCFSTSCIIYPCMTCIKVSVTRICSMAQTSVFPLSPPLQKYSHVLHLNLPKNELPTTTAAKLVRTWVA